MFTRPLNPVLENSILEKAGVLTAPEKGFRVDDFIEKSIARLT
jgi:hypothetical protein